MEEENLNAELPSTKDAQKEDHGRRQHPQASSKKNAEEGACLLHDSKDAWQRIQAHHQRVQLTIIAKEAAHCAEAAYKQISPTGEMHTTEGQDHASESYANTTVQ